MLAQCFTASWRGISEQERDELTACWAKRRLVVAGGLHAQTIPQQEYPIWVRYHPETGDGLTLVSVKADYVGEVHRETPA